LVPQGHRKPMPVAHSIKDAIDQDARPHERAPDRGQPPVRAA
jgi:hypothetical protein